MGCVWCSKLDSDELSVCFLLQAANYLDIKGLLDVTCKTVANMIKGTVYQNFFLCSSLVSKIGGIYKISFKNVKCSVLFGQSLMQSTVKCHWQMGFTVKSRET